MKLTAQHKALSKAIKTRLRYLLRRFVLTSDILRQVDNITYDI